MAPTADERFDEIRRRLDRLRENVQAAAERRSDGADEQFARLVRELGLAERRLLAEMVDDRSHSPDAFELVLADWDAYLDQLERKADAAARRR